MGLREAARRKKHTQRAFHRQRNLFGNFIIHACLLVVAFTMAAGFPKLAEPAS
jgi:hypothetical protein